MPSGNLHSGEEERKVSRNLQLCLMIPQAILSLLSMPSPRQSCLWLYHLYVDSFQCIVPTPEHFLWDPWRYTHCLSDISIGCITNISKSPCPIVHLELVLTKPASPLPFSTHKVLPPSPLHSCASPKFVSHSWHPPFPRSLSRLNHGVLSILPSQYVPNPLSPLCLGLCFILST